MCDNIQNYAAGATILGSFLSLLTKKYSKYIALISVAAGLLLSCILIPPVISGRNIFYEKIFTDFFSLVFSADAFSVFMAVVSSFIGLLIIIYSFGYIKEHENQTEYYFYVTLFIGSMLGLVFSANLILIYIFWEITAVCSWQLIGFYRRELHLRAGNQAFLVTFLGSALMLAGFGLIFKDFNTLNLNLLKGKEIPQLASVLILCGMLAKSAQLPFHLWLPDAGVAPSPVTALLHAAVLVKIGVYAFARLFVFTFAVTPQFQEIVFIISIVTILVAGAVAFVENDIKRILAYSTVSQIGYIFLGFATNISIGIKGAVFFILVHGLGKAGLFLTAGIVEHNTHEKDIRKLGGLSKTMPVASIAFLLCAFSIIGFPPFGGFFAKLFVIMSLVQSGKILFAVLAILGAVFTLLYLLRMYNAVFLGKTSPATEGVAEKTNSMVFVVLILGILSLLTGLLSQIPLSFIEIIK